MTSATIHSREPALCFNILKIFRCLTLTIFITFLALSCAEEGQEWTLNSPSFPFASSNYGWEIMTAPTDRITLSFKTFDLGRGKDGCADNRLTISSVLDNGAVMTHGTFCGFRFPRPITSLHNRLRILLFLNQTNERPEFSAVYSTAFFYGGKSEKWNGTIASPSFPNPYPKNTNYAWHIITGQNERSRISLKFNYFDVEKISRRYCLDSDHVDIGTILPNGQFGSRIIYCTTSPQMQLYETNHMRVGFISDGEVEKAGFTAVYSVGPTSDRIFNGPGSTITSPGFPNSYPANMSHQWDIFAGPHKDDRIRLDFTHFDVENRTSTGWCNDPLYVYSIDDSDNHRIHHGPFCSSLELDPITSVTNHLRITFDSNMRIEETGFSAVYTTDQTGGEAFKGRSRKITSPLYPYPYPANQDSRWELFAGPNDADRVRLNFTRFDLQPMQNDQCLDYVAVKSVFNNGREQSHGIYCGSLVPPSIISVTNRLRVEFKSDGATQTKGFSAFYITGESQPL